MSELVMGRFAAVAATLLCLHAGAVWAQSGIVPDANIQPNTPRVNRPVASPTDAPNTPRSDGFALVDVYLINEGDRLSISVLEDPNLNSVVFVRPDGRFTIPLAGTIAAAGRTPEDVSEEIRRRLAREFIAPPNVTVSVVDLGELSRVGGPARIGDIFMLGEIAQPGQFTVQLPLTLTQALAIGGGLGRFAAEGRIQVRRRAQDGLEEIILFDYEALEAGSPAVNDIELADGDVIFVPQRRLFE